MDDSQSKLLEDLMAILGGGISAAQGVSQLGKEDLGLGGLAAEGALEQGTSEDLMSQMGAAPARNRERLGGRPQLGSLPGATNAPGDPPGAGLGAGMGGGSQRRKGPSGPPAQAAPGAPQMAHRMARPAAGPQLGRAPSGAGLGAELGAGSHLRRAPSGPLAQAAPGAPRMARASMPTAGRAMKSDEEVKNRLMAMQKYSKTI